MTNRETVVWTAGRVVSCPAAVALGVVGSAGRAGDEFPPVEPVVGDFSPDLGATDEPAPFSTAAVGAGAGAGVTGEVSAGAVVTEEFSASAGVVGEPVLVAPPPPPPPPVVLGSAIGSG